MRVVAAIYDDRAEVAVDSAGQEEHAVDIGSAVAEGAPGLRY
ncbi:hypothetical protein [Microbacterium sp. CH12i]|nr:hypothetical protein [Microbacterium sp. CH12i]